MHGAFDVHSSIQHRSKTQRAHRILDSLSDFHVHEHEFTAASACNLVVDYVHTATKPKLLGCKEKSSRVA